MTSEMTRSGLLVVDLLQALLAVGGGDDVVDRGEQAGDEADDLRVVVDDEQLRALEAGGGQVLGEQGGGVGDRGSVEVRRRGAWARGRRAEDLDA
jgi:hypothetical protein